MLTRQGVERKNFRGGMSRWTRLAGVVAVSFALAGTSALGQTMEVVPDGDSDFVFTGPQGGPFFPASGSWHLSTTDGVEVEFSVSSTPFQYWLVLAPLSGTLIDGDPPVVVTASLDTNEAAALVPGTYTAAINFINETGGAGSTTRNVTLIVDPASFSVDPTLVHAVTGPGGDPGASTVTLTSTGAPTLNYSLLKTQGNWFSLNKSGGTVPGNGEDSFTITFNTAGLAFGMYEGRVIVTNTTNGKGNADVIVQLVVEPVLTLPANLEGATIVATPAGLPVPGVAGAASYSLGSVVTLKLDLEDGYRFEGWEGDVPLLQRKDNPVSITMDQSRSVSATVVPLRPTLNLSVSGTGTGTVKPTPSGVSQDNNLVLQYDIGTVVDLAAEADAGSVFVGWAGNVLPGTELSNPVTVVMDRTRTITARFERVVSVTLTSGSGGSASINPELDSYHVGQTVTLTATPNEGFVFTAWSGDSTSTQAVLTLTLDASKSLRANFAAETVPPPPPPPPPSSFDLTVNVTGQGQVTPSDGTYDSGQTVLLVATPSVGWIFSGWSGPVTGSSLTAELVMNQNHVVGAVFVEDSDPSGQPVPDVPGFPACGLLGGAVPLLSMLSWLCWMAGRQRTAPVRRF
jgi:hypothetical protein